MGFPVSIQFDPLLVEEHLTGVGHANDLYFHSKLSPEVLVLFADLFEQCTTDQADSYDEEMEGFVVGQEESFVQCVQRFVLILLRNDYRNVQLAGALGDRYGVDAVLTQCLEKATGDTRLVAHVLPDDSHHAKVALNLYRVDNAAVEFVLEGFLYRCLRPAGVGRLNGKTDGVLAGALGDQDDIDALLRQATEQARADARNAEEPGTGQRQQSNAVDGANTFYGVAVVRIGLFGNFRTRKIRIEGILDIEGDATVQSRH